MCTLTNRRFTPFQQNSQHFNRGLQFQRIRSSPTLNSRNADTRPILTGQVKMSENFLIDIEILLMYSWRFSGSFLVFPIPLDLRIADFQRLPVLLACCGLAGEFLFRLFSNGYFGDVGFRRCCRGCNGDLFGECSIGSRSRRCCFRLGGGNLLDD